MRAMLRRQVVMWTVIGLVGVALIVAGFLIRVPAPAVFGCRAPIHHDSEAALVRDLRRIPVDDAHAIHGAPAPVATALRAMSGVCSGRRNTSMRCRARWPTTASSSVAYARWRGFVRVGVDRHHLVALLDQIVHHAVRRPDRVRRCADDRDPPRAPKFA